MSQTSSDHEITNLVNNKRQYASLFCVIFFVNCIQQFVLSGRFSRENFDHEEDKENKFDNATSS